MAKVINISDKLIKGNPVITVGDKSYEVNDSLATVMKFEETFTDADITGMVECMEVALGKEVCDELDFIHMSFANIRIWFTAIMAAMQDSTYEEVEARFQQSTNNG